MPSIGGRAHTIEQIREIGERGYPFAEISLNDPGEVEANLSQYLRLKSLYGISYLAHYPNEDNPFDVEVLKQKFVPRIKKLVDLSGALGIAKSTLHFWIDKRWAPHGLIDAKLPILAELVEYAMVHGVVLCIENLSERHDSFALAFDAIPELKMTLDIGHGQLLSKKNTSFDFIRYCFPRISHIHVHDNLGGTSVHDDLHLSLGKGIVEYRAILSSLKENGYDSTITMEVKPQDMLHTHREIEHVFRGDLPHGPE
ncbi:MAG TPA: sugar phosphate isomerase/epimerase [Deltaproteobacteria bacterium]|nr:sugar phosphate isomerase/epimerase [Deltaproteobacteria bacterium]